MEFYKVKNTVNSDNVIVVDDMFLTKDLPTTAGSKMLEGFKSLFNAEALEKLYASNYVLGGKAKVGEFAFDLLGETDYSGKLFDGKLLSASAEILKNDNVKAVIGLDVNGSIRRASAQNGLVSVKPTYGTVSRYGTVPVACSGETVSVSATTPDNAIDVLKAIIGHDDKDGTSLPKDVIDSVYAEDKLVKKVAVIKSMLNGATTDVEEKINLTVNALKQAGVEVEYVDSEIIPLSNIAWNVLMSAELCNNVSRYDGVKYGYRANNFTNLDELYTFSRTQSFGKLLKTAILYGSETLSTANYKKVYDKSLRMRRVIKEEFDKLFANFDAVIMPACSTYAYGEDFIKDEYVCYKENFYTAPASITGLPAVVCAGVQFVGKPYYENALLNLAKVIVKEGE